MPLTVVMQRKININSVGTGVPDGPHDNNKQKGAYYEGIQKNVPCVLSMRLP